MKNIFIVIAISFLVAGCSPPVPGAYYSRVVHVYDGDTVRLANGEKVRYIGIDTPEMNYKRPPAEYFAQEAKYFNSNLVYGKNVRLEFDIEKRDKYGRLLAYVFTDDIFVNEEMIREGYANTLTIPPNVKYADKFRKLLREAKTEHRGLWQ